MKTKKRILKEITVIEKMLNKAESQEIITALLDELNTLQWVLK